jgi:WD40 repeat protein
VREYVGPTRSALRVAVVPGDPPRLAAVVNRSAYLWRLDRSEGLELPGHPPDWDGALLAVAPDGGWLVAGPPQLLVRWDLSADPPARPAALPLAGLLTARFVTRSDQMTVVAKWGTAAGFGLQVAGLPVSGSETGLPRDPIDLRVPAEIAPRIGNMNPAWRSETVVLSGDGQRLALSARETAVHVWDVRPDALPRTIPLRGFPHGLSFSPDGSRLAVDGGTTLYVHDVTTLELLGKWKVRNSDEVFGSGVAWSPDGRLLARTNGSSTVRVYEAATGREVMAVGAKPGGLISVAFSPDGLTLATGSSWGPVQVWDVE